MEPMVRGYCIPIIARFILDDASVRPRVPGATVDELEAIAVSKPSFWVPRQEAVALWTIIDAASLDEAAAYANLVRCGDTIANVAIGSFLKLLLKMLSPTQFAKKFPDIWSHEHKGGFVEAIVDQHTMAINIRDVEGFSHVGPIGLGFVGTALRAIGVKDLKLQDTTWTRANPGPRDVRLETSWT